MTFMYLAQSRRGTFLKWKLPRQFGAFPGSVASSIRSLLGWESAGVGVLACWGEVTPGCVLPHSASYGNCSFVHSFRPNLSTSKGFIRKREWNLKKREECWRKNRLLLLRRKLPVSCSRTSRFWRQVAALGRTKTERSKSPATLSQSLPSPFALPCLLFFSCLHTVCLLLPTLQRLQSRDSSLVSTVLWAARVANLPWLRASVFTKTQESVPQST